MRLKEAYKLNREHSISKNISEFGAVPSNPDNTAAFAKAVVWLNEQDNPACLVFEPGIYSYEASPNWAVEFATITSCGVVRLRNTGTGDAFILDGGAAGAGINGMHVGRFLIEGHDGSGDGVYIRAVHRSFFSFNIRGCGITQAALRTEWCVVDEFQITTSVNEGGWYNDGTGEAEPLYGIYLDDRGSGEATSYSTFINPILEGVGTGAYIDQAIGNQFYGGTMEACVTYGMHITANALWNKTFGLDLEANGTADIYCQGLNNFFSGMDTGFASGEAIRVTTGAKNNQFTGGSHSGITIDSGAVGTTLNNLTINRFGDASAFTDNGTDTRISQIYDYGNGEYIDQWDAPAYKTPANINVVTGGTPVGSVTDMQTAFDGNVYNLPEATGAPGIDLEINFTGVTGIKGLVFAGRYVGSSTHYIDIYLYDYNAAADQAIFRMQTQSGSPATTNEYRTILIPDDSNFIDGSGNAQISFIHPVTGNSSHDLYLDYIALLN